MTASHSITFADAQRPSPLRPLFGRIDDPAWACDTAGHVAIDVTAGHAIDVTAGHAIDVFEAELRRIASDLHDTAAQALAVARISVEAAARAGDGEAAAVAGSALPVIDAAIAEVRQLIFGLRPPLLDELGLVAAIGWCLTHMTRASGLVVQLHAGEAFGSVRPEVQVACYRIAQEAIANVVRHAHARRVTVRIEGSGDALRLEVVDDGWGMPLPTCTGGAQATLGVRTMKERAAALGGHVAITSRPGHGTSVVAVLPVRNCGAS